MSENTKMLTEITKGPKGDTDKEISLAEACLSLMLSLLAVSMKKAFRWSAKGMIVACVLLALYYHNAIINAMGSANAMGLAQVWQKVETSIASRLNHPQVVAAAALSETARSKPAANPYHREHIDSAIRKWAAHYAIHPDLAFAVAQIESGLLPYQTRFEPDYYKCHILGVGNDCRKIPVPDCWQGELRDENGKKMMATSWGLYQVMPLTAAATAEREGFLDELDTIPRLLDVDLNVRIGLAYLRYCIDLHGDQFDLVAQCYNGLNTKGWGEAVKKALFIRILGQCSKGGLQ